MNDTLLSFATLCLNYHAYHLKENNAIPHVLFGDILDTEKLVFTEIFHPKTFDHINLKTPCDSFEQDQQDCINGMKQWYCSETKHYLHRILDHYQSKNQTINTYTTIVNVDALHWIYIYVNLFPEDNENDLYVISVDGMNGSGSHEFRIRRDFAKFFGLYLKESYLKLPLTDYDFDGHDLIDDKNVAILSNVKRTILFLQ